MVQRRKILASALFGFLGLSVLPAEGASVQSNSVRQPASPSGAAVDAAVRTGRVDARIASQVAVAAETGAVVRALVVRSAPLPDGLTLETMQDSLAPDKADLGAIPGVSVKSLLPSLNTTVVEVASSDALARLAALPDATIVADELMQRVDVDSENFVGAPAVRAHGYDGVNTFIGIIDTGVDYRHPDLGPCAAPFDIDPCRVAIQPGDFSHNADGSIYDDGVLDDSIRHGTNVAATASAMAPAAKIVSVDVFGPTGAYSSDVANAIQYMINLKAAGYPIVDVNLSLGFNRPTCLDVVGVGALRSAGIIPVVAAGNSAYVNGVFVPGIASPACVPGVVSVGAVHDSASGYINCSPASSYLTDQVACFSQASSGLSILAPGVSISGGGVVMNGTSQAAPHVAGAIATLAAAVPQASAADLVAGVTSSQVRVFDSRIGLWFPRLSVPDALAATQARVPGASGPDSFDHPVVLSGASGSVSTTAGFMAQNGERNQGLRRGISSTWFTWTAPGAGRVTISTTGSSFDTAMSIYEGTALNALTEVGANDDSTIAGSAAVLGPMEVRAAVSYRIAVSCGQVSASCGAINLGWNFTSDTSVPTNDDHTRATVLAGSTGSVVSTNTFSTTQPGEPAIADGVPATKSVWFKFAATDASAVDFTTSGSNFDTTLSVFEGPDPLTLRPVVSHDDIGWNGSKYDVNSRVTVTSPRGGSTFWVSVDSFSGQTGTVSLGWASTLLHSANAGTPAASVPRVSAAPAAGVPSPGSTARTRAPSVGSPNVMIEPPCADRFPSNGTSTVLLDSGPNDPVGGGNCWLHTAPAMTIGQPSRGTFIITAPNASWRMTVPLSGDGPTVGTYRNQPADQFRFEGAISCFGFGSVQVADVDITRADRNLHGEIVALDMSFVQRCSVGGSALQGRIRYRPFGIPLDSPCVAPAGPTVVYDQRAASNPNVSVACMKYAPFAGPAAGYGPDSRIAMVRTTDISNFYGVLVGIKAKNGLRLALGAFPITADTAPTGVSVYGPCFFATGGTATVTDIQRNASDVITSLDFTFECTTPDGYFRGVERLPYF
jgi:Subtilase family